jgi:hypothetical protein
VVGMTPHRSFKDHSKPIPKLPEPPSAPIPKVEVRGTLIRNIDYGLIPQAHTRRATDIWNELQHRLRFGEHDNAIAVLFRVLLEFAVENYIARKSASLAHPNDKLAKKFSKALDHMLGAGSLDSSAVRALKKFENQEPILSAHTLNAYIHHKDFFPSDHHLKSMWDSLSDYIVICLKA